MRHSERENFVRVLTWNEPSHVCYPPPSRTTSYTGAWPRDFSPGPDAVEWQDMWGVTWTDRDGEAFPTRPAIPSIHELDTLAPPDPHDSARFVKCREAVETVNRDEELLAVNHPYFLYEKGFNILGAEEFLASLLTEPKLAARLLDIITDFELGIAAEYVELSPDHVNLSDDYGMQDRLAVSPELWREFFKPRLKRVIDFYRRELGEGVVMSLHSCGHIMPIAEDMIEIGIRILNPVQSTANNLRELRRMTSHRLVLCGGIDGQHVLPLGTPDDVRREVFRKMDMLWEGGGYLPAPEKMLGVPPENKRAMEQAIGEWSRENVEK